LIFLDIHLPKLKGFEFLESLKNPPHVIITSAYKEYALQGFDLDVLDYLVKPIRLTRFLKAVGKIQTKTSPVIESVESKEEGNNEFLFFNVGKKKVKIFLDEIIYVESVRDYVKIITKQKTILTKFQLNQIEETLSRNNFLRIHRSFIVSRPKITAFTATDIELDDISVPIGRSYKELVTTVLGGHLSTRI
jgi:DNA-binding LytR/AlgR family response regulator